MDKKAWATMPQQYQQEESHTPEEKLDAKAQLGKATGLLIFEETEAVSDGTPVGGLFGKDTEAEKKAGATAEAGEGAAETEHKPAEVPDTTEPTPDEMAEGKSDELAEVEKDG